MAIEARFRITDPGIFWSLQTIDHLGRYHFSAAQIEEIDDAYLDTKKHRLFKAGYSCRRRDRDQGYLITLLDLKSPNRSIQKPKKWKFTMKKAKNNPANWPKGQIRTRVVKVTPNKELRTILNLHQSRITRMIRYQDQTIMQANLDNVVFISNNKEQHFKVLKLKMIVPNQEKHLDALISKLQAKFHLKPEPLSKLERALALVKK